MSVGQINVVLSDRELMDAVQCGNQMALITLHDRYSRLVYSVALRVLKDPLSAEDVLQEIFMQLWRLPGQVSVQGDTLHGWFMIASRNRAISLLRKKCPGSLEDLILVSPFDLEKHSQGRLMCEKLISGLSPKQRLVMQMAYLEDMSHSEIATATGYPLGTIKNRIRSALKVLRTAWVPQPDASGILPPQNSDHLYPCGAVTLPVVAPI